jgi:hypothetical protein
MSFDSFKQSAFAIRKNIKGRVFVMKAPYIFYETGTERLNIILTVRQEVAHHTRLELK